jgi:hypothetical protein
MIRLWTVIDLDVFRKHENDAGVRRELQDNGDGTYFIAYDIRSFPDELIVAVSPTMEIALERGVYAIEPLPERQAAELDERWRQRYISDPPPDLQQLVSRFGSYDLITPEAWVEFDAANLAWQARRRDISRW